MLKYVLQNAERIHNAYVSNHIKTKTDQHPTNNTHISSNSSTIAAGNSTGTYMIIFLRFNCFVQTVYWHGARLPVCSTEGMTDKSPSTRRPACSIAKLFLADVMWTLL
jgi:hypothetical protein